MCHYKPTIDYFAYVEAGFKGEWRHYNSFREAVKEASYNEIYRAIKINENEIKELKKLTK